jgi:hypothetical protein
MDGCSRSGGREGAPTPLVGRVYSGGGGKNRSIESLQLFVASERASAYRAEPDRGSHHQRRETIDTNKFTGLTGLTRVGNPQVAGCFQTCRGLQALLTGVGVGDD